MKWFKHFSLAQFDPKMLRVIRKYGLRGYGLYFACLEMVANQLEPSKPYPDIEQNDADIAAFFGEDTDLIREMIGFFINQDLFTKDANTGRLVCFKLLAHLDNTMSNVPQIKAILENFKELEVTSSDSKALQKTFPRLDQIRVDQSRSDKSAPVGADPVEPVLPASLQTPDFQSTLADFLAYKRERRQAYKPRGLRQLIATFEKHGPAASVEAMRRSMTSNYAGVFFDKAASPRPAASHERLLAEARERDRLRAEGKL